MTLDQISAMAVTVVGLTGDDVDLNTAKSFTAARHQQVYESYDWEAAQDIITLQFSAQQSQQEIPNAENVISARWVASDGKTNYLDPVSESYLFESLPELIAEGNGPAGLPLYFVSRYIPASRNMAITLAPAPSDAGSTMLLIKRKFDDTATEPLIPNIDEVILQFVISDLWQYLRQVGRSAEVLAVAKELLAEAQKRDVPSSPKPRTSKTLTASGDTLAEMTDAVCDIIGKWQPDIRESVRDKIRREYRQIHDTLMLPESLVIANVPVFPDQEQVVLPYYFDRVLEVRTNNGGALTKVTPLKNEEISYYFNFDKDIFERSGEPLAYSMLPTVGVEALSPYREQLQIASFPTGFDVGIEIFIKGESVGQERFEKVTLVANDPAPPPMMRPPPVHDSGWVTTENFYDTPLVISKPDTTKRIVVRGATSKRTLLGLEPKEHERKHLRIWLLPNLGPNATGETPYPGSVLVLGKRKMSPLVEDGDSPQIRNVSNVIIHAAAAAMFERLGNADQAAKYATKAASGAQILIDAETKQNAYHPTIKPYVDRNDTELDCF